MTKKLVGISFWFLFVVLAAYGSIFLAVALESIAYQHNILNGTPGQFVSSLVVHESGLRGLARTKNVELAVDAPICFAALCGAGLLVRRLRRKEER